MNEGHLKYRQIVSLWVPLALSSLMMSIANPIVSAGATRLPNPAVNLAAHGLTQDIAILLESPILMILSCSVSLVRSRTSYELLKRFVTHLTLLLTVLSALVYFTPIYDVLFLRILGVPAEVAQTARPALRVMLLWPFAVGWRRLFQGVLIYRGQSRLVGLGTVFRLLALTGTVAIGVASHRLSGALIGGLAMAASVMVEMAVAAWWAMPLIRTDIETVANDPPGHHGMDYGRLCLFYLPLAGTDMMRVLSRPLTSASIARTANATLSLATWPVASGFSHLLAAGSMAVQEVVLALVSNSESQRRLRVFALTLGVVLSLLLGIAVTTPVVRVYLRSFLGVSQDIERLAIPTLYSLLLMPFLLVLRSLLRGTLIWQRHSVHVQAGMFVNLVALAALLVSGMRSLAIPGVVVAAMATVVAEVLEVGLLQWLVRHVATRAPAPMVAPTP